MGLSDHQTMSTRTSETRSVGVSESGSDELPRRRIPLLRHSITPLVLALFACVASAAIPTPFLENHCYDCHDSETKKGGLDLTALGTDLAKADLISKWVRVHDRIASGEMPPKKKARPEAKEKEACLLYTSDAADE